LTEGKPRLSSIVPAAPFSETDVLGLAASVESVSEHPLAGAIVEAARGRQLPIGPVAEFQSITGQGISGVVTGKRVAIGSEAFIEGRGVDLSAIKDAAASLRSQGQSAVFVAVDGRAGGVISVADPIKSTAREAIEAL